MKSTSDRRFKLQIQLSVTLIVLFVGAIVLAMITTYLTKLTYTESLAIIALIYAVWGMPSMRKLLDEYEQITLGKFEDAKERITQEYVRRNPDISEEDIDRMVQQLIMECYREVLRESTKENK